MKAGQYNPSIAFRMKDYFIRQIAAFEQMTRDLAVLDGPLDEAQIEALAAVQERHAGLTAEFADEFRALLREWGATPNIAPADRAEAGAFARRTEALAAEIDARCAQGTALVRQRMAGLKQSIDEVAQGHELLRKYSPARQEPPSMLDQKI